jgi:hypothetical protein
MSQTKLNNIFSVVPEEFKDRDELSKKDLIKDYFDNNIGKKNAKVVGKISEELGLSKKGSGSNLRLVCANLLEIDYYPICSSPQGYFKPETAEEIEEYIQSLTNRVKGIMRRINALQIIRRDY